MKRLILVLLIVIIPASIFAIGGFGLQGGLGLLTIGAIESKEGNIVTMSTAEFVNPYNIGIYAYIDVIPFIDLEVDYLIKGQFYDFSFINDFGAIGPYKFVWVSSSTYLTVRKSVLDFEIPLLAETNLLLGGGYNMHDVTPVMTLELMKDMLGGDLTEDPRNISEDDLLKFLRENKIEASGYHAQLGLQFKVLFLDSFLTYRYVLSDDLAPNETGFGTVNLRLGYGF